MKKIISIIMVAAMLMAVLASCNANSGNTPTPSDNSTVSVAEKATVNLATLAGPTGMGMSYMLDDSDNGTTLNKYNYTVCSSPDEITGKIVSGDYDIAALPTNAAATLYNKTGGKVQMLALNTLGVLYVLEKGGSIKTVSDLKGKTVYVSGQGATPEYVLAYLLEENGLKVGTDVKLDFTYSTHADLVAFAATGKADVVLLPEPSVTALLTQNKDMKVALNLNDVWSETTDDDSVMAMGCVVVNAKFAEENPQAVKDFMTDYNASVEKVNADNAAASEIIAKLGITPKAAVALNALPRCNIVCIKGEEMKNMVAPFFEVLYNANASSVGGAIPDENLYYIG